MELQQFKSEIDIANEHHLHNILFQFYGTEKPYICSFNDIYVKDYKPLKTPNYTGEFTLSQDKKYLLFHEKSAIEIYALGLNKDDEFILDYYMTIDGIYDARNLEMYDNLIYYWSIVGGKVAILILNIETKELYTRDTNLSHIWKIYVHNGDICIVHKRGVSIIDKFLSTHNYTVPLNMGEIGYMCNGSLYFQGWYLDIERRTVTIKREPSLSLETKHDTIYLAQSQISFLHGETLKAKDFKFPPLREELYQKNYGVAPDVAKWFNPYIAFNKSGDKMVCVVQSEIDNSFSRDAMLLEINLKDLSIVQTNYENVGNIIHNIGFIKPEYLDILKIEYAMVTIDHLKKLPLKGVISRDMRVVKEE
jgi:hypothetical protein